MRKIIPLLVIITVLSLGVEYYIDNNLNKLNRELTYELRVCLDKARKSDKYNGKEIDVSNPGTWHDISELEKKCFNSTKNKILKELKEKISTHENILNVLRMIFFASSIVILLYILKNIKNIFLFITKTKLQRAGFIVFILCIPIFIYEINSMRYPKKIPIISLSMLTISIGLFTNIFQRIFEWIKKGS